MPKGQTKQPEKRGPGCPAGARDKRSRELMLQAEQDVSPADVLLGAMRHYWAEAQDEKLEESDRSRAMDKAAELATQAAPYVHVEQSGKDGETLWELSEKQGDNDEHDPPVGPGEKLH